MALTIKLNLDSASMTKGLKSVERRLAMSSKKMSEMSSAFAGKAAIASAAFAGLGFGVKKLIDSYRVQELAERKLAIALQNSGNAANYSLNEMKEYASSLQKVTTYGDEAILSAQSMMLSIAGPVTRENMKGVTEAMLDMATVMGVDLKMAAQSLGIVLTNPAEGLTRLRRNGIDFTQSQKDMITTLVDAGKKSEAHTYIIGELNKKFGGQARAAAKGTGAMIQMQNAIGDVFEVMGKDLLPTVARGAKAVQAFAERLGEDKELRKMIAGTIKLTAVVLAAKVGFYGLGAIILQLASIQMRLLSAAMAGVRLSALLLGKGFTAAKVSMRLFSSLIRGDFVKAMALSKLSFTSLGTYLRGGFRFSLLIAKRAIQGFLGATGLGLIITFLPELLSFVADFWDSFLNIGQLAWTAFRNGFKNMIAAVKKLFTGDWSGARASMADLMNDFAQFGERSSEVIRDYFAERPDREAASTMDIPPLDLTPIVEQGEAKRAVKAEENEKELTLEEQFNQQKAELKKKFEDDTRRDELKFGKTYAKVKSLQRREEFQGLKQALGHTSELTQSENTKLFKFGKASSIVQSLMRTYEAAMSVYAGFSTIPIIGHGLGIAAAAATMAFGMEKVNQLRTLQPPQKAAMGGLVGQAVGTPPSGDHQPFLLEPGELITPGRDVEMNRKASKIIVEGRGEEGFFSRPQQLGLDINLLGDSANFIEATQRENKELGIGVI